MIMRSQFLLSALMALIVAGSFISIAVVARFSPFMQSRIGSDLHRQQQENGLFFYNGGYLDDGDYVLVGQIPYDNYERGGVYFIGSSEMRFLLNTWELSAAERRLIHNYAIGDMRHSDALSFIRALVEEHDLLAAGGQRTTVILALSEQMTRRVSSDPNTPHYVHSLFERHNFYHVDADQSLHRNSMSEVERFLRQEQIYANRFLVTLGGHEGRVILDTRPPEARRAHLVRQMGDNWEPEMRRQVEYLGLTIDYLQSRGVHVRALFVPKASWARELAYGDTYRDLVLPILQSRGVAVTDLSTALPDEDFGDAVHARYSGQQKMHAIIRSLGVEALAAMSTQITPEQSQH